MRMGFDLPLVAKVILANLFALLLLGGSPSFLFAEETGNMRTPSEILEHGVLRVGMYYQDKPPFVMTKADGSLYGVDIDIANGIAQAMGVEVVFDRTSKTYAELTERMSTGEDFDIVICKLSQTLNRALMVRFTKPYLVFHQSLALNKTFISKNKLTNNSLIVDLEKMKFKVGARQSTSYVEYAQTIFPHAEAVEGEWEELVEKLLRGEIDGLMRDEYTLMSLVRERPDVALYLNVYRIKDMQDPIAIATAQSNSMLQYWLDLYLAQHYPQPMTADDLIATYPELWEK